VPSSGEDVDAGGSPGALVVGRGPVDVVGDRFADAPFLFDGVLAGSIGVVGRPGVVEQSFVGFLPVSEGGSEVDVEIDRWGDHWHARGFRLQ